MVTKQSEKPKYPKKLFGELTLKGGLNNFKQTIKTKYLLPTKGYPEGKAVIEILVPDHVKSFEVSKETVRYVPETIEKLSLILEKLEDSEDKQLIAQQINFNKELFELAKQNKNFVVKSFRFTERDYMATQNLMSQMARLFGYLFFKYKTEIEKESRSQYLANSRNAMANGMSTKVHDSFIEGFMEDLREE